MLVMNKLDLLFESSSLRDDIKQEIEFAIRDLIDNIRLDDELMARVQDLTYDFIKEIKNEKKNN